MVGLYSDQWEISMICIGGVVIVNERLKTYVPERNGGPRQHAAHLPYSTAVSVTRQAAGQQWHSALFESGRAGLGPMVCETL